MGDNGTDHPARDRFPLRPLLPSIGYRVDSIDTSFHHRPNRHCLPHPAQWQCVLVDSQTPKSRKTKEGKRASQKTVFLKTSHKNNLFSGNWGSVHKSLYMGRPVQTMAAY